jgi:hypothetical protein
MDLLDRRNHCLLITEMLRFLQYTSVLHDLVRVLYAANLRLEQN